MGKEKKFREIRNIAKKNRMAEKTEKEKPKDHMINIENRYFFNTKAMRNIETTIIDLNRLLRLKFFNKDRESEIVNAKKVYCIVLYNK